MKTLQYYSSLLAISISFSLMSCSNESQKNGTPALFDTRLEAEKASKNFNCTGAHKMGDKWMACESHKVHEEYKKTDGNHNHHNH